MNDLVIEDVAVEGRPGLSVWTGDGGVKEVGPWEVTARRAPPGATRIAGRGAALLPGLHDHHIHLFALAARKVSVWCGPPEVTGAGDLMERLRTASSNDPGTGWIRAVGWDDTSAGMPDRFDLDAAVGDRPVRLQHRSGVMWVLNGAGLDRAGLSGARGGLPAGVELGVDGTPTGRVVGLDRWLGERLGSRLVSLGEVSEQLASRGVTGVTDATAHNAQREITALATARGSGELHQNLTVMTASPRANFPRGVLPGSVKIVVDDAALPAIEDLSARIVSAHERHRVVAVHAVTRVGLVLALEALRTAGTVAGDRIEHASVAPQELIGPMAELGVTVVTQPQFILENGDRYLATVSAVDLPWMYRGRGLLAAGVPLAAGSDAPVGGYDPWRAMQSAVRRETSKGIPMTPEESVTPEQALALFTGHPHEPGGPPRRVLPGAPADLCLLDRSWASAREALAEVRVRATVIGGRVAFLEP